VLSANLFGKEKGKGRTLETPPGDFPWPPFPEQVAWCYIKALERLKETSPGKLSDRYEE
jgi:hypothetical protein